MAKDKMKRALIFDPYLDTLGGGERYTLSFALALIKKGFSVDLAWTSKEEINKAEERFGLDLSGISINPKAYKLCVNSSILERFFLTKTYDLIFWVSDGSLPFLFGKNNIIHFQVPFTKIGGNSLINRFKMIFIKKIVYNSKFTQKVIENSLSTPRGFVLYPPIDTNQFIAGKKEKIILSVARFSSPSHSKRQDILIDAFRMFSSKIKGYRLILVGGHFGDNQILENLEKKGKGLSVDIIPNPNFNELKQLYSKAKYFWHAAGYGIDENKEPEKVEHFGMTTVEAMSAGCIPVVIDKGGQKEIILEGTGLLFNDTIELANKTIELEGNPKLSEDYQKSAIDRSRLFSTVAFNNSVNSLL